MSFTTLTFASLEVLSATKMNQLYGNTAYFKSENAIPVGAWTFTPGSAIVPISITQNSNADCIDIVNGGTQNGLYINQTGLNASGKYGLYVYSNTVENVAGSALALFNMDNAGSTNDCVSIINDGEGLGLYALGTGINYTAQFIRNTTGAVAYFWGDGNNSDRLGIYIACGTDDNSGTNGHIYFLDGNGDVVGSITSSGGTVSYNAFTGGHYAKIENFDDKKYIFGKIVILKKILSNEFTKSECHQPVYEVELSSKAKDKRVFGVYAGKIDDKTYHIYGLGDGFIWVCKEGGNIENGDYITTSNKEGYGMKQDDDLLHNYTVAKSLEDVDWSKEKEDVKLIAATYHAS